MLALELDAIERCARALVPTESSSVVFLLRLKVAERTASKCIEWLGGVGVRRWKTNRTSFRGRRSEVSSQGLPVAEHLEGIELNAVAP